MTRGRKPLVRPTRSLHIHIDAELADQIDARLWSDAEQRIPKGAYQAFITEAVIRMMRQKAVDLSPYANTLPLEHVVFVYDGTEWTLKTLLEGKTNANHDTRDAVEGDAVARES